ncbi:hypothetical protein RBH26_01240 [Natronolimnohabitans sp. A-GB9]|uniref:hypothetical protein n=1 Tax=Natronolimnohabitans sp. A-GB9 TaxID=3069757 RepID=UPI0027B06FC2|nr:hypothetical protein [Natronolimnohabitans sp. A-GB9]MDQ2049098.1 hypothetical protein [Natronolimnohabitans sp. A-GB9]
MQTLEVTDEQYAAIQQLRAEISERVVGKYGFVREQDAIQFLIDNLEGNPEVDVELDVADASATDDVATSVDAAIDGDSSPADLEEVSYVEDENDEDDRSALDASEDGLTVGSETGPDVGPASEADTPDVTDEPIDGDGIEDDENDVDGADGDESDGDGAADDDDMLNEMMSLLETHDDKWEESSSSDYRYSVDLPDGTTEEVQTKDDVRALLFKNYR